MHARLPKGVPLFTLAWIFFEYFILVLLESFLRFCSYQVNPQLLPRPRPWTTDQNTLHDQPWRSKKSLPSEAHLQTLNRAALPVPEPPQHL